MWLIEGFGPRWCCYIWWLARSIEYICGNLALSLFLVSEIVAPVQTLAAIMGASMEELARCPGIGERKVRATRCFTSSFELHLTVATVAEYVIILVPKPTKNAQKKPPLCDTDDSSMNRLSDCMMHFMSHSDELQSSCGLAAWGSQQGKVHLIVQLV